MSETKPTLACVTTLESATLTVPIPLPLVDIEREVLIATVRHFGGNKKAAAKALKISRSAIYAKLRRLGLLAAPCARCGGDGHAIEACPTPAPEPMPFPTQENAPPPAA